MPHCRTPYAVRPRSCPQLYYRRGYTRLRAPTTTPTPTRAMAAMAATGAALAIGPGNAPPAPAGRSVPGGRGVLGGRGALAGRSVIAGRGRVRGAALCGARSYALDRGRARARAVAATVYPGVEVHRAGPIVLVVTVGAVNDLVAGTSGVGGLGRAGGVP